MKRIWRLASLAVRSGPPRRLRALDKRLVPALHVPERRCGTSPHCQEQHSHMPPCRRLRAPGNLPEALLLASCLKPPRLQQVQRYFMRQEHDPGVWHINARGGAASCNLIANPPHTRAREQVELLLLHNPFELFTGRSGKTYRDPSRCDSRNCLLQSWYGVRANIPSPAQLPPLRKRWQGFTPSSGQDAHV